MSLEVRGDITSDDRDRPQPALGRRKVGASQSGFTLVELMVSLFIFALIAAAGVALLGFSVRAQGASDQRLKEVAAIRRVNAILAADLAQAAPRISRNRDGAAQPAFLGGTGEEGEPALAFVRRGWDNAGGDPRSSLQRVEYRVVDDRLERQVWPMVDGAEPLPPAVVLRGVGGLALRYRDKEEWRERWDSERPGAMPRAVEAVIDLQGVGPIRQLFLIGTGY